MEFQLTYDPGEDRLLLALGMPERTASFWLTRRMTALLWQVLWQRAGSALDGQTNAAAKEWLLSMQQDEARQRHVLTQGPRMELQAPPFLVTTVNYGPEESGGHKLELIDAQGKGESLKLDDSSLYVLIRLLDETAAATEWGLNLWRPMSSLPEVLPASKAFH